MGCDSVGVIKSLVQGYFNPRTPGGVRHLQCDNSIQVYYFNPRTPGGVRRIAPPIRRAREYFNPRTPGGVRPIYANGIIYDLIFQSTHPGWGATRDTIPTRKPSAISIHAPRVGCDFCNSGNKIQQKCISIHAPRVGCDFAIPATKSNKNVFQSTHPGWGATAMSPVCA